MLDIGLNSLDYPAKSLILYRADPRQLFQPVGGNDLADRAGQAAHHQAVGAGAIFEVAHTLQQVAVGNAGGRKEDILR